MFVVTANGAELARTRVLRSGAPPVTIDVALPETDVLQLSLQTIADNNSTPSHNLTVWADPTLHRRK